ncbi:MAG: M28 family peptidase [Thermoplasmatota archaeon]
MNRKALIGIGASVTVVILIAAALIFNVESMISGDEGIFLIDFDHEAAGVHVRELVSNGPRMSGSDAELAGAEYIQSQFVEAGLEDVHIESYPVPMFEVVNADFSLVEYRPILNIPAPLGEMVAYEHMTDFVLQGYSGSRSWNSFRDDLTVVNIGNGTDPGSYDQSAGRVCFIEQTAETPSNSDVYFSAYNSGARAIILQNCMRGETIGYPPMFKSNQNPLDYDNYPDIPFFMVSRGVGDEILDKAGTHKLRIDFNVRVETMEIRVVVGDMKGERDPEKLIVIGGHHDTCYNTIGVVDNTVGPATIIEMARSMVKYETDKTIRFCTFGGEEEGLFGSIEYYAAHEAEFRKNVDLYINFDMPHTDEEETRYTITTTMNSSIPRLRDLVDDLVREESSLERYDINVVWNDMLWPASDHWPFTSHGNPGMGAWGSGCAEYHTYQDDLRFLNTESLQIGGRVLGSYALYAAS